MLTYVIRRLLYSTVVLFAASVLVFWGMSMVTSPIGFLEMQPNISQQTIQNIKERKHLDEPIYVRYGYWVKDMFTNKFGTETVSDLPIWPDLQRAMGHTLQLIIAAELLAILIAVFIGVYSALRQYSVFDYAATTFSFVGLADTCLLARAHAADPVRQHLFMVRRPDLLRREPELGRPGDRHPLRPRPRAAPGAARSSCSRSRTSRRTRASCAPPCSRSSTPTTSGQPGRRDWTRDKVTMRHAFRNALIPLVTLIALNFGALLGGAIITETMFALDGMGALLHHQLNAGDPYPVMAFLMVTAVFVVIFNLIADLAYGWLDPTGPP